MNVWVDSLHHVCPNPGDLVKREGVSLWFELTYRNGNEITLKEGDIGIVLSKDYTDRIWVLWPVLNSCSRYDYFTWGLVSLLCTD